MKIALQIFLWLVSIVLGYMIYNSVNGPIEFKKIKQERYAKVIANLKDIRNAQEAYKTVNGRYANDFNTLVSFIDTGKYVITQQRDSSYLEYDKHFGIDMLKEVKIVDTLGLVPVKDSLFKKDDRYKTMMNVPYAANGEKFEMKSAILEKGSYKAPVFEAKVSKKVVLHDQPATEVARENTQINVDEVNGSEIKVGSLTEVSTSGNWPSIYDKRNDQ